MTYFRKIKIKKYYKYANGYVGKLIATLIVVNMFTNLYFGHEKSYLLAIPLGLFIVYVLFMDKVKRIETTEILRIDYLNNCLSVFREGACVFNVEKKEIRDILFEPFIFMRFKMVIQLNNYNRHEIRIPVFGKTDVDKAVDLLSKLKHQKYV